MKYTTKNHFKMMIPARSQNEAFARSAVSAFAAQLDPTVEELGDIKAAVSEAVTNCIVHAYADNIGMIELVARILQDDSHDSAPTLYIRVKDKGCGIADIERAKTPLFTTCAEGERAGLGFAVMESFTDRLQVRSKAGAGTTVTMYKRLETRSE
ncbi:MAG: anti-sigma F factor [Oscillospiraceae bacterium]|nr:anti-sigma F factor [Oscillospiraceae bacterium]